MMKKTNLIMIGMFLLIIPLVYAPPPGSTILEENRNGLQIEQPLYLIIPQNANYTFVIHTYNISNGVETDGVQTSCVFHIYDNLGKEMVHIEPMALVDDGGYKRYEANISGGNFTRIGFYDFLIFCNQTSQGGFVREVFEVTKDGFPNEQNTGLYISLTLIFIWLVSTGLIFYFWRGETEQ